MVLAKKERVLMNAVYSLASGSTGGTCLISPSELLAGIPYNVDFRESDLEETMNKLMLDNYFSYEKAKKINGDPMFVITLKENGISYERDRQIERRKLIVRIIIAAAIAAFSASIKFIISAITGS